MSLGSSGAISNVSEHVDSEIRPVSQGTCISSGGLQRRPFHPFVEARLERRISMRFPNRSGRFCPLRKYRVLSDNRNMQQPITRDPDVMHGTPVFRGTRVPVKTMFEYLESGESLDDFLEGFPTVNRELAVQVLEESRELRLARV